MKESKQFRIRFFYYITGWLLLICLSFAWNSVQAWNNMIEQGRREGRMAFMKDLSYRHWNSSHGGVYVPVTETTRPNPYLLVPNRDVTTTAGQQLTLINPAYMSRQVFALTDKMYGIKGHITSLTRLNPANAPDAWEKQSLRTFEQEPSEITALTVIDGERYLRFMRPMITEKPCLKCHGHQGYRAGNIRGGISVSVPMGAHIANTRATILNLAGAHLFILLTGSGLLLYAGKKVMTSFAAKEEDARIITEQNLRLAREHDNFLQIFHAAPVGLLLIDNNADIVMANRAVSSEQQRDPAELPGKHAGVAFCCVHCAVQPNECGSSSACHECPLRLLIDDVITHRKGVHGREIQLTAKIGDRTEERWFSVSAEPVMFVGRPHIILAFDDIIVRKKLEERLREYGERQKTLLREVNHRVKNNLTAIISMLHREEDRAAEQGRADCRDRMKEIVGRVDGLLIVHSMLSATKWRPLQLAHLCREIMQGAVGVFAAGADVTFTVSPSETLVNAAQAHDLALVFNELATNTLKYGSVDRDGKKHTEMTVAIEETHGSVRVVYRDSGCGFAEPCPADPPSGLGIGLGLVAGIIRKNLVA